ncbi:MAG: esterase-like activity of phytase family protein [Bacteroidia bacterium]|nr:esterase-like activity of phytase family protein [Bacteroidia bacterium]
MKLKISTAIFGLFAFFASSKDANSQIIPLQDYSNKYSATIGTYQGILFREGGFSGMYMIPGTNGQEFWVVSDRGVNIDAANANSSTCRPTYDKIYSFPSYAPKLHRVRISGDSVQILQTITLKRPNGTDATGIINPTGFGSSSIEVPSTDTVMNCSNFSLKTVAKDIWGIDAEGVALDKNGNFWICEEGGPTIWVIAPNGVVIKRYTPYANLLGAQPQDIMIDSCFKYRKNNRGFEGITIAPNGKIYAIIQSPILYPTKTVGENTRIHRILEIDPATNATKMYVYLNDGIIGTGGDQIRLRDWKIGDMAAINDSTFLVLEAAKRGVTDIKRMYKISINGATAVNSGLYGGVTLEALVDNNGLTAQNIKPVTKSFIMDFLNYGWDANLDKIEGLAIINDSTIAVCNDNDYAQFSANEDGIATATNNTCHIQLYRLRGTNKLNNYVPLKYNIIPGLTGPSTSHSPYMVGALKDVQFTSILTSGESINNYMMTGLGDGIGAYDNGNGTFTVLLNHEMVNSIGRIRAHGAKGAYVSKWIINKSDLSVVSGSDLIKNVYLWNGTSYTKYDSLNTTAMAAFNRFCSADLPMVSAFYNASTGLGTQERIFMNGEESGSEGRAFAHIVTGANAGSSYELPYLGKFSWENSITSPNASNKTIVVGTDDATPGQVYIYVGNKTNSGTDVQKAGLIGGKLYGVTVNGLITESSSSLVAPNTTFTMTELPNIQNATGSYLNSLSNANGVTNFLRPEDGVWDVNNPNDFYFVTTNSFTSPSRLYRLRFIDINNPELGGNITAVLDGTEGPKMMDNIGIDNFGHILIQEDPGNQTHTAKVWQYTIATDELKLIADHDNNRFISGASNYLTQDEESSGIIDVQNILGPGMFILYDQAHYFKSGEVVEGGQLLAMYNPETFNSNPEIVISGNSIEIANNDNSPSVTDNSDFGSVASFQTKTFSIKNTGAGLLSIKKMEVKGLNATDYSFINVPVLPLTISSNNSLTFTVKFTPGLSGLRTASIVIGSNDVDEMNYTFSVQGIGIDAGLTGPNSTQSPYMVPAVPSAKFTSIMTAGDYIGAYRMCGLGDGIGAYDNGNGTFTVILAHEMGNAVGVVRAHGNKGAFISKWIINKSDLSVISGSDLIKTVYLWEGTGYVKYDATNPVAKSAFSRFCSADLPEVSAFYNAATGKGTQERIFMNGEESGSEGRAFAHIVTGPNSGTTYELPYLGKFSWENSIASPYASDKTIVAGTDDATPGQLYFYIGTKTSSGNEIEKAGLNGGKLFGVSVTGLTTEVSTSFPAAGTAFTLKDLGQVQNLTGSTLNTNSNTAGVTNFLRPEDGLWDPSNPNDFYFVTTNSFTNPSRLWRLRFTDINNPELGGTITVLLDGTEGPKMMDNIGIDNFGHILIQEDPGNQSHTAKVWQYTIATDALKIVGDHDQTRFTSGSSNYLTQDEESSGIIDVQNILGPGMFILYDQAHYSQAGEVVEGGQLLAFYNPDTYLDNPEIVVSGNGDEIRNGSIAAKPYDNTDFGQVKIGNQSTSVFEIKNNSIGDLTIKSMSIEGLNAADFTFVNAPSFPLTIASGSSVTFTIKFTASTVGLRKANVKIISNDVDEKTYTFAIQGTTVNNTSIEDVNISLLNIYPNPSNNEASIDLGLVNNAQVSIQVIDMQGKVILAPFDLNLESGEHTLQLNTSSLSSGMYVVEFTINGNVSRYRLAVAH